MSSISINNYRVDTLYWSPYLLKRLYSIYLSPWSVTMATAYRRVIVVTAQLINLIGEERIANGSIVITFPVSNTLMTYIWFHKTVTGKRVTVVGNAWVYRFMLKLAHCVSRYILRKDSQWTWQNRYLLPRMIVYSSMEISLWLQLVRALNVSGFHASIVSLLERDCLNYACRYTQRYHTSGTTNLQWCYLY